MKLTIAICTWNRCELLERTLESLVKLNTDGIDTWDVAVVDNNSTDGTAEVITRFQDRLPLKSIFEARQGHSVARNAAVVNASGDWVLWTDNDVLVDRQWMSAYRRAINDHPEAAFLGGKIEPVFEPCMPTWISETWEKCKPVFAARDLGDEVFQLGPEQFPYGANFAMRTDLLKLFPFDELQGRNADGLMGDDETGTMRRAVEAGHYGIWVPESRVKHLITPDRATPEYVGKYFEGRGAANIRNGRPVFQSPFRARIAAAHHNFCYRIKRQRRPADEWVSHLIRGSIARGEWAAQRAT